MRRGSEDYSIGEGNLTFLDQEAVPLVEPMWQSIGDLVREAFDLSPFLTTPVKIKARTYKGKQRLTSTEARAAKVLRMAAAWWKVHPSRFHIGGLFKGPPSKPTAMCSAYNIYYHNGGGSVRPMHASLEEEPSTILAVRTVLAVAGHDSPLTDLGRICSVNNNSSRDEMISYFEEAADRLERLAA